MRSITGAPCQEQLWGSVPQSLHTGRQLCILHDPCQAEICYFENAVRCHEQIRWLHVPVEDTPFVNRCEALQHLPGVVLAVPQGEKSPHARTALLQLPLQC